MTRSASTVRPMSPSATETISPTRPGRAPSNRRARSTSRSRRPKSRSAASSARRRQPTSRTVSTTWGCTPSGSGPPNTSTHTSDPSPRTRRSDTGTDEEDVNNADRRSAASMRSGSWTNSSALRPSRSLAGRRSKAVTAGLVHVTTIRASTTATRSRTASSTTSLPAPGVVTSVLLPTTAHLCAIPDRECAAPDPLSHVPSGPIRPVSGRPSGVVGDEPRPCGGKMTIRDHARAERDDRRDDVPTQEVAVNAYRTDGALVLVAPMPGVAADDVEIRLEGSEVRLSASLRSDAPKDYLLHEWDYGAYQRVLDVGDDY